MHTMTRFHNQGVTLAEMLLTVSVLAIVAVAALPGSSSDDARKLQVAAEETANTLRLALSEARRTGGYVLVDGKSASDHLRLYYSDGAGTPGGAIGDPLSKRAFDLDLRNNAFSPAVALTPQFQAGGAALPQLLIGPGLTQLRGWNGGAGGALQANSGVLLSYGTLSGLVGINPVTGLVTPP
jgi:prepilin-type N-terminal cleavage/methylation domain-containing protein